ncbi:uncharacterized protein B0I36DRAFT_20939 [Microdochium trichocladiopsis]|uniref:Uncharacterized protein n=1 Tax=Microdochium trichocladiopsis TaxID=1682393 RepID=A0A9P8YIS1_9PEZI|nr:uncharacterized protein B0I36DRAFT_20939 [Microdochium trichocladiopsis]KAH7041256.1 hypothetical protein B0I36DRAFT_20939 [Microdochium trichocladiopsis]
MEESEGFGHTAIPTGGSIQARPSGHHNARQQLSALTQSEPRPTSTSPQRPDVTKLASSTSSIPTLRFPRPLGNRQLTNWVSSSSPDIMQPSNPLEEDQILADLGYDVIGADGESQAESVASSFDYQRPDDVQSLGGTDTGTDLDTNDADTDSSDDEEEIILDDAGRAYTYAEIAGREVQEEDDAEAFSVQSLENPTNLLHHSDSFPELAARTRTSTLKPQPSVYDEDKTKPETLPEQVSSKSGSAAFSGKSKRLQEAWYKKYYDSQRGSFLHKICLLGLGLGLTWGSLLLVHPSQDAPKTLSTVPVASVSTEGVSLPTVISTTISSTTKTQTSLQAAPTSICGKSLMPVVLDTPVPLKETSQPDALVCAAEIYSRNEILLKIPLAIKASWLAKDAIKLAVSRDGRDMPTNVTTITAGFLIEVPVNEAHGAFEVSILTERKPKIHEVFKIDFGQHTMTDVLDVSKQLVRDLALYVANAVNETTTWVHEVSAPAVDEGAFFTQTMMQRLASLRNQLVKETTGLLENSISKEELIRRGHQIQVELKRATLDMRDELSLTLLTAQLSSKLWWLKIQGRTEEYQRYLSKAEAYYKSKDTEAARAKAMRGAEVKREMRDRRGNEPRPFGKFWRWGRMTG